MAASLEYNLDQDITIRRPGRTRLVILVGLLLILTMTTAAYFIGFYVRSASGGSSDTEDVKEAFHKKFQSSISTKEIESHLR